jgi:hypothetical protein
VAIGQTERLDYLLKKIGYTNSKTGIAVDSSLSGTKKAPFAESIPSPLVLPGKNVWSQSNEISTTPPTSSTSVVGVYTGATALLLTEDNTVSNKRAFLARSTPGNNSSAMLSDWVDTQFGSDYIVKIYAGNPPTAGVTTQLSAGGSGNNDEWFFDYSSGVLNFIDTNVPTLVSAGSSVWLVGYRYIGEKGVFSSGDDLSVGIITATSTLIGGGTSTGTASQKLQVGSASTPGGAYISGSVGIGTTNATSELHVVGNVLVSGISTLGVTSATNLTSQQLNVSGISTFINGPVLIGGGTSTGTASQRLQVTGGAYVSGNLGIGTSVPTSTLHVVGDTYISGIVTAADFNSSSDIRLKTNIKPFENTLEKIVQINGVSFNWIENNAKSGGIIAQDVEKVFPELVNDGDHKTVNYNGLIGVLVESIKELKQEIEELKQEVEDLKSRID